MASTVLRLPEMRAEEEALPPSVVFCDATAAFAALHSGGRLCDDRDEDVEEAARFAHTVRVPSPTNAPPTSPVESDATDADPKAPEVALGALHATIVDAIAGSESLEKLRGGRL